MCVYYYVSTVDLIYVADFKRRYVSRSNTRDTKLAIYMSNTLTITDYNLATSIKIYIYAELICYRK